MCDPVENWLGAWKLWAERAKSDLAAAEAHILACFGSMAGQWTEELGRWYEDHRAFIRRVEIELAERAGQEYERTSH